ncbi:TPA: anaerobic sulfite reductase subunit AsrB [Klebsiella aerogenes]|nr:anaerobic sulfite reductase subunit AsrB [Klebsiella aerogenes]HDS6532747.1 anaerobic sulfite reductase subunit AsrB [Klebsiella aerogenes]HDS7502336.1 anaerobic sulfite reductase subunit AsrB [Klebsiella aerogenes]HDS9642427.1 anaerobic sulfite reductase subunit AsrB [Klebsiella aerogenes]HDU4094280.1 anaerobic sulfite reductase subunit AsrB [Klebsiella aerogenes]
MSHLCNCHPTKHTLLPSAYPVISIQKHTSLEWNFRVAADFKAEVGQFVEVSLPLVGEAPISVSDCGTGWIDLMIRNVGKVTRALFSLSPGDPLWLRGCYGHGYPLEVFRHRHLLVIAGGTGVAPVKGLLRYFSENPAEITHLDMILGFKNRDCILYRDELPLWRTRHNLILTLDEGEADGQYRSGRVTDHLRTLPINQPSLTQAIVVGPPAMIKFTVKMLLERGFHAENIWVDYERRMACSVGKCGHCRMGDIYVCVDGPVFNYTQARFFTD